MDRPRGFCVDLWLELVDPPAGSVPTYNISLPPGTRVWRIGAGPIVEPDCDSKLPADTAVGSMTWDPGTGGLDPLNLDVVLTFPADPVVPSTDVLRVEHLASLSCAP